MTNPYFLAKPIIEKNRIENLFILATSPTESAWGIATHTAQRLSIEADNTWKDMSPEAGKKGLKAARAIGMLTYEQGVAPFRETTRLSAGDKAKLMGGTLQKVYNW